MASPPTVKSIIVVPPPKGGPSWAANGTRLRRISQAIIDAEPGVLSAGHLGAWQVCHDLEGRQTVCKITTIYEPWSAPDMRAWMGYLQNSDHVSMPYGMITPVVFPVEGRDYHYGINGIYDSIGWFRWADVNSEHGTWTIHRYDALSYYTANKRFDF